MFENSSRYSSATSTNGGPQSPYSSSWETSPAVSRMLRPSGKSIYQQRKEYAESLSKEPDAFQYRVEHLLTNELDGRELVSVGDCVDKLKLLDARGRVWGQDMILEVQRGHLQLEDIETKEELESLRLDNIVDMQAVLDSCAYSSLLGLTVQERASPARVFLFQCDDPGAEQIRDELKSIQLRRDLPSSIYKDQNNIRSNLENIISQGMRASVWKAGPPATYSPSKDERLSVDRVPPRWSEVNSHQPWLASHREETFIRGQEKLPEKPAGLRVAEPERSVEIFNHVAVDLQMFLDKVSAAVSTPDNSKKKQKNNPAVKLPPMVEFESCFQKIKYGFNLLAKVNGHIHNPSAADFVHILFSSLGFLMSHAPRDLPSSILSPFLTEKALLFLGQELNPQEDQLWKSLGNSWNTPRSKWPDGDQIPPYIPAFYDGWVPPAVPPDSNVAVNRGQSFLSGRTPEQGPGPRTSPPQWSKEPPLYMRVMYDFLAKNSQELSVLKGDVVEVLDKSRQWWRVRNSQGQEGHVPQNLLEDIEGEESMRAPPTTPILGGMSRPEDVRTWLEHKGFSQITVRTLGVLSGQQLLGMTRDELRTVSPEEGSRVFFHLQGVKSALALASESGRGSSYGH